jgi:hypothetical protein
MCRINFWRAEGRKKERRRNGANTIRNVKFGGMAAVAMEMTKMQKKHKNDHSRLLAEQKLMNLDRNI